MNSAMRVDNWAWVVLAILFAVSVCDDGASPIRIKLAVPPYGLGRLANDTREWLHTNVAPAAFAIHSARAIGGSAMVVHFVPIEFAQRDAWSLLDLISSIQ